MFNPMLSGPHVPVEVYRDRGEEQIGQQDGYLVRLPTLRDRLTLQLGRLFFRIGEKLTHENPCPELAGETA
jgi:hypothetical protein